MSKLYNVLKTDNGLIAVLSNVSFCLVKKFYPEMVVVSSNVTKAEIIEKHGKVKFEEIEA